MNYRCLILYNQGRLVMYRLFTIARPGKFSLFSMETLVPISSERFFTSPLPPINFKSRLEEAIKENMSHRACMGAWRGRPPLTPTGHQVVGLILKKIQEQYGVRQFDSKPSLTERLVVINPEDWIKQHVERCPSDEPGMTY